MSEVIGKLRQLRSSVDLKLKPNPYLKSSFVDEYGDEHQLTIRNYQAIGIMNMLQMPNMILGDDTGLGKTLQILTSISYVLHKEPEYIPIVITKKSALFQWKAETSKFMDGIGAITVNGTPYQRDEIYAKFFNWRDDKSLLIMTYDTMLKDCKESVVTDNSTKPSINAKKNLKKQKDEFKKAKEKFDGEKEKFDVYLNARPPQVSLYIKELLKPRDKNSSIPEAPYGWTSHDQEVYNYVRKIRDTYQAAKKDLETAKEALNPKIIAPGIYHYMCEMKARQPDVKFMIVFDEIHTLKNYKGKIHEAGGILASISERKIGLTATPIKNRLMEFFSILRIIEPKLFPKVTHFQNRFCVMKMQNIGRGRQVPVVVGHTKDQLDEFVSRIEPYYLSRKKHEVAKELPELVTMEILCELSDEQEELYDMAEAGLLNKASEMTEENEEGNGAEMLSALVLVQQACNAPQLICDEDDKPFDGRSSKIEVILEKLQGDLEGIKTIIFSRFEKFISLIESELTKNNIKSVRITGKENKAEIREANKKTFQDPNSGVNVILITLAGSESINLQAAEHTIYADSPWSWGDYVQLTGRSIRIGSTHKTVFATHLVAVRQNGKSTIDSHVIKVLRGKKKLSDKVAGESLENALEFSSSSDVNTLFKTIADEASVNSGKKEQKKITVIKSVSSAKSSKQEKKAENLSVLDIDFSDI